MKCPKHRIVIDEKRPFCPECRFPLQCPQHMQYVNISNCCEVCGRPRDERSPKPPKFHPNRCHAHMIESDRNGNCGYCGRPANDPFGPIRDSYATLVQQWEEAVAKAEQSMATAA